MHRFLMFTALVAMAGTAWGASYDCELRARDHLMEAFEVKRFSFGSGDRPSRVTVKRFETIVQDLPTQSGERVLSLWLGTGDYHAAASRVPLGHPEAYLNLVLGDPFAVVECRLAVPR